MHPSLLVAIGGATGSVARWWLTLALGRAVGAAFPWGTILINIAGSATIGIAAGWSMPGGRWAEAAGARVFVMTGLCGGFTTFSAFSLQTVELLREGRFVAAGANVALSVSACAVATAAGFALASRG